MKLCAKSIPRPSLNWLSRAQVWAVRDKLIGVFPAQGEMLSMRCPHQGSCKRTVKISVGIAPRFELDYGMFWLKCPPTSNPYWDFLPKVSEPSQIERVAFNADIAAHVALSVKSLSKDFPFLPTDNYLTHPKDKFYA